MKKVLPYAIYLFPLQAFAIEVNTTRFDLFPLSILTMLAIEILYFKKIRYLDKLAVASIGSFVVLSMVICFFFQYAPISRYFSALLWLSTLIYLAFASKKIYSELFYKNLINSVLLSIVVLMFQYFVLKEDRPRAFYIEPSTAGLIFYSLGIMLIYRIFYLGFSGLKKKEVLLLVVFFLSGLITKSSHLVLVFIVPLILIAYNLNMRTFFVALFLMAPIFGILVYVLINDPYVLSKFNFSDSEEFNLSQLAWLRGLDQAIYVAKHSPIFGYGIGSTGMFNFYSEYNYLLEKTEYPDLNLLDAYSLFFRLVVEVGLGTLIVILYLIHLKIKKLMKGFRTKNNTGTINQQCLFIFGLCIFIGSLIKEPNYGLSPLFVSIICMSFSIVDLNKKDLITTSNN